MESEYVKKWLQAYDEKHWQQRLSTLDEFCEFIGKTPDEVILEHHQDISQDNPLDIQDIGKTWVNAYFQYLMGENNPLNDKMRERSISYNSARQYAYSKLLSFFKRNKVGIEFQKGEIPSESVGVSDRVWRKGDTRISKDEKKECIKQIRDTFSNTRDKAILLCKISSGMDDVDLFTLKMRDYKRGYYPDFNVAYIEGTREKNGMFYQTFFNSEACTMLDTYFKDRERKGEQLTDSSRLFVSLKANSRGRYKKIKRTAFSENLKEACGTLGIQNVTPKSFRKWFNSELKRNGVDHEIVERMMGHKGEISMKYKEIFEDQEEFTEIYVENIESFTLLGNGNAKLSKLDEKVEELELQVEVQKGMIEKLIKEKNDTDKELRELISKNSKILKQMAKHIEKE
jgi:integrase